MIRGTTPLQAWRPRTRLPSSTSRSRFSGDHAFPGLETAQANARVMLGTVLQWGHAFPGVETPIGMPLASLAASLQWGHAFPGVETPHGLRNQPPGRAASMGPRLSRRGDCRRRRRSTPRSSGFNGATPFQAWRLCPRPSTQHTRARFNGATPFQAWRHVMTSPITCWIVPLQWGHAFPGVETTVLDMLCVSVSLASMGPRLSRRGD